MVKRKLLKMITPELSPYINRSREWKEMNNWKLKKINEKENWWKGKAVIENKSIINYNSVNGS